MEPTTEQLGEQARGYGNVVSLCLMERRCRGLIFWGFTDRHSWIPSSRAGWGAALPPDANCRPKPAYEASETAFSGFYFRNFMVRDGAGRPETLKTLS